MVEAVKVRGLGSRCLASTAGERRSAVFMREVPDSQDLRVLPEAVCLNRPQICARKFQNFSRRIFGGERAANHGLYLQVCQRPRGWGPKGGGISVI